MAPGRITLGRKTPIRMVPKRAGTALAAMILAMPFAGCGSGINLSSLSFGAAAPATSAADDDAKCQSSGFIFGTPEYTQCRQTLEQQRSVADTTDAPRRYYGMQR
jgi:hypothetical protein